MKILIVEDDYAQAEMLAKTLEGSFDDVTVDVISTEHQFRESFADLARAHLT